MRNLSIRWGAEKTPGQQLPLPQHSSASMSFGWLFLGRMLSSRARLRFTNQGQHAVNSVCRSRILQRTANYLLTGCLTPGGKRSRTLIGAEDAQNGRHWNRNVPFARHLAGAMKSIASLWKRQFREQETYSVSELTIYDAEGQAHSPFDNVRSPIASADQHLIERDEEDRILAIFSDDPDATLVLNGWMDGLSKNEIMLKGGLEAKKYAAIRKRIRLKLLVGTKRGDRNDA